MTVAEEDDRLSSSAVTRVRVIGAVVMVLCFSAMLPSLTSGDGSRLRAIVFDVYQRIVPRPVPTHEFPVRIVEIDQASIEAIGPWPWPRSRLSKLAQEVLGHGAYVVGFDAVFPEPDRYGADSLSRVYPHMPKELGEQLAGLGDPDEQFSNFLGRADSFVVLGRAGTVAVEDASSAPQAKLIVPAEFVGETPADLLGFDQVVSNLERFDHMAAGIGFLNGPRDSDGIIRRMPVVAKVSGTMMPSFALELIRIATHAALMRQAKPSPPPKIELDVTANGMLRAVSLGHFRIPVQPDGRMPLHFSPPVKGRTISALAVMNGSVDPNLLRDKIAIIGLAALGIEDVVSTPLASKSYGADIHAQAIESIFAAQWLVRPGWAIIAELLAALVAGVAAVVVFPLLSPRVATVATTLGILVFVAAGFGAFAYFRLLLDATLPLIGAVVPALVVLSAILIETERHQKKLREELTEQRVTAAAAERELEIARQIQFTMVPDADALEALPDGVEVAAVLEPAQGVGGDLYDAFALDENRLFFLVGDVSGKGISAALFMSRAKALSQSVIMREETDLLTMITNLNTEISRENKARMFVTALCGIIDLQSGTVQMCDAGHERPLLIRADGTVEECPIKKGVPLCTKRRPDYSVESMTLVPGEILIIVTDGVTEARAPDNERFGRDQMLDVLRRDELPASARAVVDRLTSAVRAFEGDNPETDDLTVMAIRYLGPDTA